MKYEIFEHKSDVGLRIFGSSFVELLENAGHALFDIMADVSAVEVKETIDISVQGDNREELFMAWLRELLYLFHGERYLLKEFEIGSETEPGKPPYLIKAVARGEKITPGKHTLHGEVKGATYHNFEVKEKASGWEAKVILDV